MSRQEHFEHGGTEHHEPMEVSGGRLWSGGRPLPIPHSVDTQELSFMPEGTTPRFAHHISVKAENGWVAYGTAYGHTADGPIDEPWMQAHHAPTHQELGDRVRARQPTDLNEHAGPYIHRWDPSANEAGMRQQHDMSRHPTDERIEGSVRGWVYKRAANADEMVDIAKEISKLPGGSAPMNGSQFK